MLSSLFLLISLLSFSPDLEEVSEDDLFRWLPAGDYDNIMMSFTEKLREDMAVEKLQPFYWWLTKVDKYYTPHQKLPAALLNNIEKVCSGSKMKVFKVIKPGEDEEEIKTLDKVRKEGGNPFVYMGGSNDDGVYRFFLSKDYYLVAKMNGEWLKNIRASVSSGALMEESEYHKYKIYKVNANRSRFQKFLLCPVPEFDIILMAENEAEILSMLKAGLGEEISYDVKAILEKFSYVDESSCYRWLYTDPRLASEAVRNYSRDYSLDPAIWDKQNKVEEQYSVCEMEFLIRDEIFKSIFVTEFQSKTIAEEEYNYSRNNKNLHKAPDQYWNYLQENKKFDLDGKFLIKMFFYDERFLELVTEYKANVLEEKAVKSETEKGR